MSDDEVRCALADLIIALDEQNVLKRHPKKKALRAWAGRIKSQYEETQKPKGFFEKAIVCKGDWPE